MQLLTSLWDRRREKASHAKRYLEEKQRELEIIERNMMELNELMRDFAVMVESANEPLDQIDSFLKGAKVHRHRISKDRIRFLV